jgi:hypothetical protein
VFHDGVLADRRAVSDGDRQSFERRAQAQKVRAYQLDELGDGSRFDGMSEAARFAADPAAKIGSSGSAELDLCPSASDPLGRA